jgi:hypothetical protein
MADFPVYDVTAECRTCGAEFATKGFTLPQPGQKRWGLCPTCGEKAKAQQDRFQAPRQDPVIEREAPDLTPPRRIWEPD